MGWDKSCYGMSVSIANAKNDPKKVVYSIVATPTGIPSTHYVRSG